MLTILNTPQVTQAHMNKLQVRIES